MLQPTAQRLRGFTLIEIMVVIILIGVVAAVVVPQLSGSGETVRLDAATRRVADMMDFCYHSAASSGRVHALLFDQTARQFDVVCEPAPPPVEAGETATEAAPADAGVAAGTEAPAGTEAAATTDSLAAASADPTAPSPTGTEATGTITDEAAQLGLTRVRLPGFLERTLPDGVGLSAVETFETDLSAGENEGQFKILFFPDGTSEFAKVELSVPTGQRRVVVLNGMGGTISIFDPDRHGEIDMTTLIADEDNPVDETGTETGDESGTAMEESGGTMSGSQPAGGGNMDLFGSPSGQ